LCETWQAAGGVVAAMGTERFAGALADMLRGFTPYEYTVIFGYSGPSRPIDLYDDFPADKRQVFVSDYQEGPYMLDPFYLASVQPVDPGLYRMRDLAPDRFYQGEYFRTYYIRTGLAEEIGFFVDLPRRTMVVVSLMRASRIFSTREVALLRGVFPFVAAACRQNWATLADSFDSAGSAGTSSDIQSHIRRVFETFGQDVLTPREREVVEYTLKGHSADAAGRILGISPGTVRIHRRNIYAKLRITSQGELFSRFFTSLVGEDRGAGIKG
jgi:DNA-binding CsgD family transcriptional regulator